MTDQIFYFKLNGQQWVCTDAETLQALRHEGRAVRYGKPNDVLQAMLRAAIMTGTVRPE